MCGIFGYFDSGHVSLSDSELEGMRAALTHRGPDDSGVAHMRDRAAAVGNTRLSIIDVDHGHQPFESDDGQIALVQNGAIFNYPELAAELETEGVHCRTSCDTEVLLRLYELHGIEFVERLNGMFAIAILDAREDCVYLIRDRVGEKPLHYSYENGRLLFASEIKSMLAAMDSYSVSERSILDYLTLNYVPPPQTMFKGVFHVMPGHWLRFDRTGMTTSQWWKLADTQTVERSEEEWIAALYELLDDSVRVRLRADVPFGAFLSGGVDSTAVVGFMSRHLPAPVRSFSIGFDDPRFDESQYSNEAARRFGTSHVLEIAEPNMFENWPMAIEHCDQPHGDVSFLPTHRVAELASRAVKMVLTGDGADELFGGYDKYEKFFRTAETDQQRPLDASYLSEICLFTGDQLRGLLTSKLQDRLGDVDVFAETVQPLIDESKHMDPINQALYIDTMLLLPGNNLVKPDRMGMAVSIENRAPFLDYRVIELAFSAPGDLKLRAGETKYLLKRTVGPLIGDDLAYRKKQMFTVPVGEWLRTSMFKQAHDLLLSKESIARGLFKPTRVEEMLSQHRDGLANYTREIRALMALEIWFQVFMPQSVPAKSSHESAGTART